MTLIMALSLFSTLAIGMMPAYLSAKPQKLPSDGRSCSAEKETGLAILSTILGALLPMVVSILLGFVAACFTVPRRTGGGGILRVPQRSGLHRHDGSLHRPNTLNKMTLSPRNENPNDDSS